MPTDPTAPSTATPQDSQALYRVAKSLIPGGTQLLSKRPEMFAPEQWPGYYREAGDARSSISTAAASSTCR